jgi:Phage integrase family
MIERAATSAGLDLKAHPHMLRHACGYALANKGHDTRAIQGWLGNRSITSTAVYTALAPNRFKDFHAGWGQRKGQSLISHARAVEALSNYGSRTTLHEAMTSEKRSSNGRSGLPRIRTAE